jgi:RimJ/RimL family protein N-acetyltransferase
LAGRVPAARCNINNAASKASLLKAGFKIAGFMVIAEIKA